MKLAVAQIRARLGADLCLASVAKSAAGVAQAYGHYPLIAQKHHMMIVMANCLGPSDDFIGAGRSAAWNLQGQLVGQFDDRQEGVLVHRDDWLQTEFEHRWN